MTHDRPEIRQWLVERGFSRDEIEKILMRLDQFDSTMTRDAVFDAIASGEIDMEAIVKEALGEA